MRVAFTGFALVGAQAFSAGVVADLPDAQAGDLVAAGLAVSVEYTPVEPEAPAEPIPATPAASAARRRRGEG